MSRNQLIRSAAMAAVVLGDGLSLAACFAAALLLRFEGQSADSIYHTYVEPRVWTILASIAVYLLLHRAFRLHRREWRFAGLEMLRPVTCANSLGLLGLIALEFFVGGDSLPRSVLLRFWMLSIAATGGLRVAMRLTDTSIRRMKACRSSPAKRAVIVGSRSPGALALKAIREHQDSNYNIIGFLDDDPGRTGMYISNVRVLGRIDLLGQLMAKKAIDEVIIALPPGHMRSVSPYISECKRRNLPVRLVPDLNRFPSALDGSDSTDIPTDSLLRRAVVKSSGVSTGDYVSGKNVLVTGAGGSIGLELCRQILSYAPRSLVLLGHGENAIHNAWQELSLDYPDQADRLHCVIASVADDNRISAVFDDYRPDIVFHTAAHKHVPLMEVNEPEAVSNNVMGTAHVADASGRYGVERFVLISTDKAADPCSIMGGTKWLCGEVLRASAVIWPDTRYVTVRFGNVLGSRGSVVTIFQEQIKRGGPVTVTHPEMTRFFMTTPEAVHLVIQAGAIGESGGLYLLEMGQPIRLMDLAEDMIRQHGLEPGVNIEIKICGIRPGERLHEQLISERERIEASEVEGILIVQRPKYFEVSEFMEVLAHLDEMAASGNAAEVRRFLESVIDTGRTGVCPVVAGNALHLKKAA